MNERLKTYAIGTLIRVKKAIENGENENAIQLCIDGIALIKSWSTSIETNSLNDVEIF